MNTKKKKMNQKIKTILKKSHEAYLDGDFERVIELCDEALLFDPECYQAWDDRGIALLSLNKEEDAGVSFDKGAKLKQRYENLLEEAKSQYLSKDFNQALTNCDKALTINPECYDAWNVKGVVLGKLGKHQEAIDSLNQALEIKSTDCKAWYNLGNALCELDRLEDALTSYNLAIDFSDGDYYEAWHNRGTVLFDLGRLEEAIASYDKALQINPNDHETWNDKGVVLSRMGKFDDALKSYNKAIELNPDAYDTWHNQALTLNMMTDNPTN